MRRISLLVVLFVLLSAGALAQAPVAQPSPTDVWGMIRDNPWSAVIFVLLVLSEALASIPAIQANSVFQLVVGALKKLTGR